MLGPRVRQLVDHPRLSHQAIVPGRATRFLPAFPAAQAVSRSCARPRTRFLGIFAGWFAGAATDPAAGYTGADYAQHIRTEFSTFRWLLEPMLAMAGFEIVTADFERNLYGAYTCIKTATG